MNFCLKLSVLKFIVIPFMVLQQITALQLEDGGYFASSKILTAPEIKIQVVTPSDSTQAVRAADIETETTNVRNRPVIPPETKTETSSDSTRPARAPETQTKTEIKTANDITRPVRAPETETPNDGTRPARAPETQTKTEIKTANDITRPVRAPETENETPNDGTRPARAPEIQTKTEIKTANDITRPVRAPETENETPNDGTRPVRAPETQTKTEIETANDRIRPIRVPEIKTEVEISSESTRTGRVKTKAKTETLNDSNRTVTVPETTTETETPTDSTRTVTVTEIKIEIETSTGSTQTVEAFETTTETKIQNVESSDSTLTVTIPESKTEATTESPSDSTRNATTLETEPEAKPQTPSDDAENDQAKKKDLIKGLKKLIQEGSGESEESRENNTLESYTYLITGGYRSARKRAAQYLVTISGRDILSYYGDDRICAGTIIAPNLVITTAHCVKPLWNKGIFSKGGARVVAGTAHRLWSRSAQERMAVRIVDHPKYSPINKKYDIAILVLDRRFELNENVQIVPLASENVEPGAICTVVGWGRYFQANADPNKALQAPVQIWPDPLCQAYTNAYVEATVCSNNIIDDEVDMCQGTIGSPLICNNRLTGVALDGLGCSNSDNPTYYTDIYKYLSWIANYDNRAASNKPAALTLCVVLALTVCRAL